MAGTKNVYNSEPLDIVVEALEKSTGAVLQRQYLDITLTPQSDTTTLVTLSPKLINGFSPYVDSVTLPFTKLDLRAYIPGDMCYSSQYPVDYASFTNFMMASYGLLVKPGQWEIFHGSNVFPVDESMFINDDLTGDRFLMLRPTAAHPIFRPEMIFPLLVTEDTIQALMVQVVGPETGTIGDQSTVQFQATGGLEPYSFRIVEGTTPVPLNAEGDGLEGQLTTTGRFDYKVEVEDSLGQVSYATGSMEVELQDFTISIGAPDGFVHQPYSYQYDFSGGLAPYSLVRVDSMPMGLSISDSGLLSGLPDAGDVPVQAVFQDSLGTRFTLTDNIHIAGREEDVVRTQTKLALVDWLELSAGYAVAYGFQSYPAGSQWATVDLERDNIRMPQGAAVKLQRGYLVKTSAQAVQQHLAVVLFATKGDRTTGGCVFSTMDGDSGLEISVSDLFDTRLRIRLMIDGQSYGVETPDILDDSIAMITVQAAEGYLSVHRNQQLILSSPIPQVSTMVTADNPITIGRRSNFTDGYQWNGALSRVMVFNKRLWGDQIAFLCKNGYGANYRELQMGTELAEDYKIHITASMAPANAGQQYDEEVILTGAVPVHAPILIDGQLPFGVSLNASNPQRWVIKGIPSAPGVYVSYWGVQGPQETAAIEVRIVVS